MSELRTECAGFVSLGSKAEDVQVRLMVASLAYYLFSALVSLLLFSMIARADPDAEWVPTDLDPR